MDNVGERIRNMPILRFPDNQGEIDALIMAAEFTPDEEAYWDDMERRRDSQVREKDYERKAEFYLQELERARGRFEERVYVERRLKQSIGHSYECLGTFEYEIGAQRRIEALQNAILWYQQADETIGVSTGYAFDQFRACQGIENLLREEGFDESATELYKRRADQLLRTIFGEKPAIVLDVNTGEVDRAINLTPEERALFGIAEEESQRKKLEKPN